MIHTFGHLMQATPNLFIEVIVPLPVPNTFTYTVPAEWQEHLAQGMRVVVPFGKQKLYTGMVYKTGAQPPKHYVAKPILDVQDETPVVNEKQLHFWEWISDYYLCFLGDVLSAALPGALQVHSETKLVLNTVSPWDENELTDREYLVCEALEAQHTLTLQEVSNILGIKTIHPIIKSLMAKGLVWLHEEAKEKYKPKTAWYVKLNTELNQESKLQEVMNSLSKAPKQTALLMRFIELSNFFSGSPDAVAKITLQKKANASANQVKVLVDKGIFTLEEQVESRLESVDITDTVKPLNTAQQEVADYLRQILPEKPACLLHGVTSSGKTEVYIDLMESYRAEEKQVLYLLPEIALTTQIIKRLQARFGEEVGVYHSRLNQNERVEVWNNMLAGKYRIVLGARSAVFLPFESLGLIIVDEEHESSFKQYDPAPRYHARDAAVMLGRIHKAHVLLGSATPSVESYYLAKTAKYGFAELTKRYGEAKMPLIRTADLKEEHQSKTMRSHFSSVLLNEMEMAFQSGNQVILFQNRRGFSPYIQCTSCGFTPGCTRCDVNLTYHKQINRLKCHYCGYHRDMPTNCEQCGSPTLELKGFGTEKVEDELQLMYPDRKIQRLDLDTTRGKNAYNEILSAFARQEIDVLVGTQMVTKGLDFERVGVVGVLNADSLLSFPDFRAHERSFQLMTQVAGRAGRKKDRGTVVIQTYQPSHPIIQWVTENNYTAMYESQLAERKQFKYPPGFRLIRFTALHTDRDLVNSASGYLSELLRRKYKDRVLGPEYPIVARIKNRYHKQILLKLERDTLVKQTRAIIQRALDDLQRHPDFRKVRIIPDVDPA